MNAARRGLVAVALLSITLVLTGCGVRIPPLDGPRSSDASATLAPDEYSTLDAEGIDRILASGQARFDLSDGEIDKSSVGLADTDYAPDVSSDDGLLALEIVGPDGTLAEQTDRIRFFTTDASSTIDRITFFLVSETPEEFFDVLRDGVSDYGLDRDEIDRWIESVDSDPDATSDFAFTPGTSLGMDVSYDVRYDATSSAQVVIVQVYPSS